MNPGARFFAAAMPLFIAGIYFALSATKLKPPAGSARAVCSFLFSSLGLVLLILGWLQ